MWMLLCVERVSYLEFGNSRNGEDRLGGGGERLISCRDGRGLIRIAKQRAGEKRDAAGVS